MSKKYNIPKNARIYIDANICIYWLEDNMKYSERIQHLFQAIEISHAQIYTSKITISECLFWIYKNNREVLKDIYDTFFESCELINIDDDIVKNAPLVWVKYSLKLIDAIHMTSAEKYNCNIFITNDKKISSHTIQILQLSEL